MAKFVINSAGNKAIRAKMVSAIEIAERTPVVGEDEQHIWLLTLFTEGYEQRMVFEGGDTFEEVQGKAVTVLQNLEAADG